MPKKKPEEKKSSAPTIIKWEQWMMQVDEMIRSSNGQYFERVVLLKQIYEDPEFRSGYKKAKHTMEERLSEKLDIAGMTFPIALRMLTMFPDKTKWEKSSMRIMVAQAHQAEQAERRSYRSPVVPPVRPSGASLPKNPLSEVIADRKVDPSGQKVASHDDQVVQKEQDAPGSKIHGNSAVVSETLAQAVLRLKEENARLQREVSRLRPFERECDRLRQRVAELESALDRELQTA